jgi:hypothetical protein
MKNIEDLAAAISSFVNGASSDKIEKLGAALANDHPTLQQNKMRLACAFIEAMAAKPYVDARNETSHETAKAMIEGYRAAAKKKIIDQDGVISDSMKKFIDESFPSQYLPFI